MIAPGVGPAVPERPRTPNPGAERTAMLTAVMRHPEDKSIDEAPGALDLFKILGATRLAAVTVRSPRGPETATA
ncbi:hypothetical protein ACFXEL_33580 [Streptomyces sp. NPDC059382]|uniref:hypothetical protein n=1 Tax=Streptomyces sp. NPDC059382 TaxID=3346816 RepID=UPI0036A5C7A5